MKMRVKTMKLPTKENIKIVKTRQVQNEHTNCEVMT